jgi:hypothetical protein
MRSHLFPLVLMSFGVLAARSALAQGDASFASSKQERADALLQYLADRYSLLGGGANVYLCPEVPPPGAGSAPDEEPRPYRIMILDDCSPQSRARATTEPGEALVISSVRDTADLLRFTGYREIMGAPYGGRRESLGWVEHGLMRRSDARGPWYTLSTTFGSVSRSYSPLGTTPAPMPRSLGRSGADF